MAFGFLGESLVKRGEGEEDEEFASTCMGVKMSTVAALPIIIPTHV